LRLAGLLVAKGLQKDLAIVVRPLLAMPGLLLGLA